MKKIVAAIMVLSFIVPTNAQADIKQKPCKKSQLGKIKNDFICVKKNKKYKWIKLTNGEISVTSSSTPTPSPTPTPTAPIIPSNPPLPEVKPSATPEPKPTEIKEEKIISEREKLFNFINSSIKEIKNSDISFNISKNFPTDSAEKAKQIVYKTAGFFDKYLDNKKTINFIFITEKDLDFLKSELSKYEDIIHIYNNAQWATSMYKPGQAWSSGGIVTKTRLKGSSEFIELGVIFYPSYGLLKDLHPQTIAHETTHAYQHLLSGKAPTQNFDGVWPNVTEKKIYYPCHMFEGGANFFGYYLGSANIDELNKVFIQANSRARGFENSPALQLTKSESWLNEACSPGYYFGQYFYEWLAINYGINVYFDLITTINLTIDYKNAMIKILNKDMFSIYKEAEEYISREIKIGL